VGEKMSGKTSLIAKLLDEPIKDDMKETTALDFRYGTRVKDEKRQKINLYELGKTTTVINNIVQVVAVPCLGCFRHQ
jgi:molybdopterin-guanine dinucleotide biosynthesis protein